MRSEAQARAQKSYEARATVQMRLKINKFSESDILDRLRVASEMEGGKVGYIKSLIREDIARNEWKPKKEDIHG